MFVISYKFKGNLVEQPTLAHRVRGISTGMISKTDRWQPVERWQRCER
jgi:hypothetical protein